MADILVVAELADGKLKKTTHSAITFARRRRRRSAARSRSSSSATGAKAAAAEAHGVRRGKVLVADDASLANYVAERYAPTVADGRRRGFDVVVGTASAYGKDLSPRVAAQARRRLRERHHASVNAGRRQAHVQAPDVRRQRVRHLRGRRRRSRSSACARASSRAAEPSGGASPGRGRRASPRRAPAAERVEFVSLDQVKSERPELAEATVVVSGGRALKEKFSRGARAARRRCSAPRSARAARRATRATPRAICRSVRPARSSRRSSTSRSASPARSSTSPA